MGAQASTRALHTLCLHSHFASHLGSLFHYLYCRREDLATLLGHLGLSDDPCSPVRGIPTVRAHRNSGSDQWLRTLLLPKTQVPFPAPAWWLMAICLLLQSQKNPLLSSGLSKNMCGVQTYKQEKHSCTFNR